MKITSSAFISGGNIPIQYTCEGDGISPPLSFEDVPREAKSLALIVDDPDVPKHLREDGLWIHWVLFNLSPNIKTIEENQTPPCNVGLNTSNQLGYVAPCPPDKQHRYRFKLYALDTVLKLKDGSSKEDLMHAMESHILAKAELLGLYDRHNRTQN